MSKTMPKSVIDYIPNKKKHLLQVKLPVALTDEVKTYLDKNNMTWKDLVQSCLLHFRDTVIRKK